MDNQLEHGPTWYKELEHRNKIETFDRFVDLALDGVITVEQAIEGFKEEYGTGSPESE